MANKITIQHYYTTGSTAPTNLELGEIAIAHKSGEEAIFIRKNGNDDVKFIPKKQIENLISTATSGIATTENLNKHIGTTGAADVLGHVKLANGDLSRKNSVIEGEAAASYHTHGQYLTGVTGDSGQAIVSLIENGVAKIALTTGITSQINSGVSGYTKIVAHETNLGETGATGHVKLVGGDLSGKTGNVVNGEAAASNHIHSQYIAKGDISTGLEIYQNTQSGSEMLRVKPATSGGIIVDARGVLINPDPTGGIIVNDNGVSISETYKNNINSGVTAYNWGNHADEGYAKNSSLISHANNTVIHVTGNDKTAWDKAKDDINAFMAAAESGTTALDTLKEIQEFLTSDDGTVQTLLNNLSGLTDAVSDNTDDINELKERTGEVQAAGPNIAVELVTGSTVNLFRVSHTTAGTQTSEIKATNTSTGLSFGSEFKIVDKIAYDANGHVVSGSTQTLKLPIVNQASSEIEGIVTTTSGDLKDYTDIPTKTQLHYAAHRNHTHSQYVRFTDLNNNTGDIITISCGTY